MAQTFDNRNLTSDEQQTFYPIVSSSSRPNKTNTSRETSLLRQSSPIQNHSPLPYEATIFNKHYLDNQQHSPSSLYLTSKNSTYYQKEQPLTVEKSCSDPKLPPSNRITRLASTTNYSYIDRTNALSQNLPNGMKTNTTYLNTTQLYITQPLTQDNLSSPSPPPPPPPPPRCPVHPPTIPPRNSSINHQKNYITIPDFNSSVSSKVVYRSPVTSSVVKRNDLNGHGNRNNFLEHQLTPLSIDNNHDVQQVTNELPTREYLGECCKCGERITNSDDACDILGQIYHSFCAVCAVCGRSVKNRHFFLQDQLYCEEDFLYTGFHETLEYCVVCGHLITDTILQALGKSYHLACFKCSKCSLCLDGVPFLKDEKQNLFCLHDYHMTYAPRCDKCSTPICPDDGSNETVRIISMGKTFHTQCYQCEDCAMQLGNEHEQRCYPLGDALLCQECCHQRLICQNKF